MHLHCCGGDAAEGARTFPGDGEPAYLEFAYFAVTIRMCFQSSDVTVTSRQIRRAVLGHPLLWFSYSSAVVATAVSLVVGVLG